ncbi:MAG: hypothetical protein CGW95_13285 [Phenylobacterium zucineum]|nr:MAG: hypothetical protein CGW95_13285 [Phenylobacterium zucineum]
MTFADYLAKRQARDNPQGDFVRDAREDARMADMHTWPQLQAYLYSKRACHEAIEAGRLVWRSYQQFRKSRNA